MWCQETEPFGRAVAAGWTVQLREGLVEWFTCPADLDDVDHLEAEVNDATVRYQADSTGRITGLPGADT